MNKFAEQIREKVSLADHIDKYVNKASATHWERCGKCDSNKKTYVSTFTKNGHEKYSCFHCGDKACDIIDWTQNWYGIDFWDACKKLSEEYGIPLDNEEWEKMTDEEKATLTQQREDRKTAKQFMNDAIEWYHDQALKNKKVIQYWKDRGISMETIQDQRLGYAPPGNGLCKEFKDKYDYETMQATGLVRDNDWCFFQDRYVYPYWNGDQCVFMIGGATKTTRPRNGQKKAAKYVKMACHSENNPQINDLVVQHVLYGADRIDDEKPVLVAEGIVDAILGRQELGKRYNVISPVTAKMNNKDIEKLAKRLDKLDQDIIICNDTERNETGKKAALKTAQDFYAECVKNNPEVEPEDGEEKVIPWRPKIKIAVLRKDPGLKKVDMADYIKFGKIKELIYWIEAGRTIWEYESYLNRNPNRFFEWNKNQSNMNRFQPKKIVDEFLSEGNFVVSVGDNLFIYNNGYYQKDLNGNGDTVKVFQGKLQEKRTPNIVSNSIKDLVMATQQSGSIFESDGTDFRVNAANGILDLNKFIQSDKPQINNIDLIPHTPDYMSNSQIAIKFNPKATCPLIDKFLPEVLDLEDIPEFWKAIGYTLLPLNEFHKSFLFYGPPGTGKGTAQRLIEALLGSDNYTNQSLEVLEKNRFRVAELYGKMANICGELESAYLPRSSVFKQLTGGDTIAAEEKGQKPFSFICRATMFFSANELPTTNDKSDASLQRWKFFGFDTKFRDTEREDPFLKHKLTDEKQMEGFLIKSLYGLWDLIHNGFQNTRRGSELSEEFKENNDSVYTFGQEYLFEQEEVPVLDRLGTTELYRIYKIYHDECGVKEPIPSARAFNKRLQKIYPSIRKNKDSTPKWLGLGHDESLNFLQNSRIEGK